MKPTAVSEGCLSLFQSMLARLIYAFIFAELAVFATSAPSSAAESTPMLARLVLPI